MNNNFKNLTNPEPITFTHKIGSTTFTINLHQATQETESLEEKILRMMKNDLKIPAKNDIIGLPKAVWATYQKAPRKFRGVGEIVGAWEDDDFGGFGENGA